MCNASDDIDIRLKRDQEEIHTAEIQGYTLSMLIFENFGRFHKTV